MAVTTRNQQASALGFGCPLPLADEVLGFADRQQCVWVYAGILSAAADIEPVAPAAVATAGSGLTTEHWEPVHRYFDTRPRFFANVESPVLRLAAGGKVRAKLFKVWHGKTTPAVLQLGGGPGITSLAGRLRVGQAAVPVLALGAGGDTNYAGRLDALRLQDELWLLDLGELVG